MTDFVSPPPPTLRRREFLAALGAAALAACHHPAIGDREEALLGRLSARPRAPRPSRTPRALGVVPLRLTNGGGRDGLLYVPAGYRPNAPMALVVMLHGSDTSAKDALAPLQPLADSAGMIVLAPDSRERTWDIVLGSFGADVAFIDRALDATFRNYAIDPGRIAIAGFSDGASEALSLGVTNGEMFTRIMAFSPGLIASTRGRGRPLIFDAYGDRDTVFPSDINHAIVRRLRSAGYDVREREFADGHTIPPEVAKEAIDWLLSGWS